MKNALIICTAIIFSSCGLLNGGGIIIDTPTVPSVNICENVASDADVSKMKEQIDGQSFKDERMDRAKLVTKGYCFKAAQVVLIMDSMVFADDELEMAKHLYKPTTDKENYYLCIDALAHKSDRDELKAYIAAN
jgi:hypothetical protein